MSEINDLILVIDMQNVYDIGQPWECKNIKRAIDRILQIDSKYDSKKQKIILTKFIASENPSGRWIEYNRVNEEINKNEFYNEIVSELSFLEKKYDTYTKSTYSSLTVKEIQDLCLKAKRVVITGVVAECCVLFTLTQAVDMGCEVIYLSDAVSGFTDELEEATKKIIQCTSPVHSTIMTTDQYLSSLE